LQAGEDEPGNGKCVSDKYKGSLPVITELEPPRCSKWSVQYTDGTPAHIVRMTADHTLGQDIFTCDCGCKYTWSKERDYDEPCRHVVAVTTALLVIAG
jgi:hypothetical protein